jgi:adenosylcobinamide kinase/adenosylcobinamide-phosphate guanylyltransferase
MVLVTGGSRSGKSRFAEGIARSYGAPLLYLATGSAGDEEMRERIAQHRSRRGEEWRTVEEPLFPASVMGGEGAEQAVLLDCVTLWVANLLHELGDPAAVLAEVERFIRTISSLERPLVLVTNEVGMGIVPDNPLARAFRDLAGRVNELLADAADEVYVVFSGLPLKLKG